MDAGKKSDYYTGHNSKKRVNVVFEISDLNKLREIYGRDGIPIISQIVKYVKDGIKANS